MCSPYKDGSLSWLDKRAVMKRCFESTLQSWMLDNDIIKLGAMMRLVMSKRQETRSLGSCRV